MAFAQLEAVLQFTYVCINLACFGASCAPVTFLQAPVHGVSAEGLLWVGSGAQPCLFTYLKADRSFAVALHPTCKAEHCGLRGRFCAFGVFW